MKTLRSETVVLNLPSTTNKYNFPDVPNLRDRKIVGISVRLGSELTAGPTGQTLASDSVVKSGYLTLVENSSEETFSNVPLVETIPSLNDGKKFELEGAFVNFPKSYVSFGSTVTPNTNVVFVFYYEPISKEETAAQKARASRNAGQACN